MLDYYFIMAGGKPLSLDQKTLIISLKEKGIKNKDICSDYRLRRAGDFKVRNLNEKFIGEDCLKRILKSWNDKGTILPRKSTGRPKSISNSDESLMIKYIDKSKKKVKLSNNQK